MQHHAALTLIHGVHAAAGHQQQDEDDGGAEEQDKERGSAFFRGEAVIGVHGGSFGGDRGGILLTACHGKVLFAGFGADTNAAIQLGVAAFVRDADVVAMRVMPGGGGRRLLGAGGEQEEAGEEKGFHGCSVAKRG
ncbi:hypothetical protein HMPREF9080_02482 [Cardiobacterium valvarum F0432]|uniref:Uncharacterized protein n=1 Tax=Cardiobacterium valvarum F0432 TaxID=797473 RepID=G9ZI73_9GAMM|nr:hypothetical protein HMPREF9080_02482 [Cardiobacterium valvarum F0432]